MGKEARTGLLCSGSASVPSPSCLCFSPSAAALNISLSTFARLSTHLGQATTFAGACPILQDGHQPNLLHLFKLVLTHAFIVAIAPRSVSCTPRSTWSLAEELGSTMPCSSLVGSSFLNRNHHVQGTLFTPELSSGKRSSNADVVNIRNRDTWPAGNLQASHRRLASDRGCPRGGVLPLQQLPMLLLLMFTCLHKSTVVCFSFLSMFVYFTSVFFMHFFSILSLTLPRVDVVCLVLLSLFGTSSVSVSKITLQ